ncbi:hypothetical protein [Fulvivirga sediminis]|uniref:Uncharacterized protein n=1 Tax=Fulvivirga sediminis TaxID=2803949 RepID=A0A937FAK7_9BACT|nr:hypothetical protein [Fulvivirga sediminis]MBL3657659.1 hypothetical protein [Fulvivirga sediminis]
MFDSSEYPKGLDEDRFTKWLEEGRDSKISYNYLLVVWDDFEADYQAVYVEDREEISKYERYQDTANRESLIAAYDLYSESRIV